MLPDTSTTSINQSLTEFEKLIYNSFLATSRKIKNQPFKFREDFSKFEPSKYILVKKLSSFFNRFKNINLTDFFSAPYYIYNKDEYFDLQFYTTRKALVCYSHYMTNKQTIEPDSDESLHECKDILKFIYNFCADQKITLEQYKTFVGDGTMPVFFSHLKNHNINFYTLHALEVEKIVKSIETDLLNFYFENFYNLYKTTRNKFITSTKLKHMLRKGLDIISNKLLIYGKQGII